MPKKIDNLWESSRMMLPEHKSRIIQSNQDRNRREKPKLDPAKWEEINERLGYAYQVGAEITLSLHGLYESRTVTGVIAKIDILTRKLCIAGEWIRLTDILDCSE